MPAVQTLCAIVELCISTAIPIAINLISINSHHIHTQVKVLIAQTYIKAIRKIRSRITNHCTVFLWDDTVAINIGKLQVTRFHRSYLIGEWGFNIRLVLINSCHFISIEVTDGITFGHTGNTVDDGIVLAYQWHHFIINGSQVGRNAITPVFTDFIVPGCWQFKTTVTNLTCILQCGNRTGKPGNSGQQIFRCLVVINGRQLHAATQQVHIKAYFPWVVAFPAQCLRNQFVRSFTCNHIVTEDGWTRTCNVGISRIPGAACVLTSQNSPRAFQLQIINHILFLHEVLFAHYPTGTKWVEVIPCISRSLEYGRTVATIRGIKQVTVFIVIQCTEQIGHSETLVLGCSVSCWCGIVDNGNPPLILVFANGNTITWQLATTAW